MNAALEVILAEMLASLAVLTNERTQRVARIKAVEQGLKALAAKAAQVDRRLTMLERMVKN